MKQTYTALNGVEIQHEPDAKTERFLAEVAKRVADPKLKENDIIGFAYGPDNPMLAQDPSGRGLVTKETFANPSNLVLADLLYRKRVAQSGKTVEQLAARHTLSVSEAAKLLGVTPDSVRKQIRDFKLSGWKKGDEYFLDRKAIAELPRGAARGPLPRTGTGILRCVAGSARGLFLLVKAPGYDEDTPIGSEGSVDVRIRQWRRIAVLTGGQGKLRMFVLEYDTEPRSFPEEMPFHEWLVEGPFKIVEKFNNAAAARVAWDKFRAA
jgi:excisionase family DNA binding protein